MKHEHRSRVATVGRVTVVALMASLPLFRATLVQASPDVGSELTRQATAMLWHGNEQAFVTLTREYRDALHREREQAASLEVTRAKIRLLLNKLGQASGIVQSKEEELVFLESILSISETVGIGVEGQSELVHVKSLEMLTEIRSFIQVNDTVLCSEIRRLHSEIEEEERLEDSDEARLLRLKMRINRLEEMKTLCAGKPDSRPQVIPAIPESWEPHYTSSGPYWLDGSNGKKDLESHGVRSEPLANTPDELAFQLNSSRDETVAESVEQIGHIGLELRRTLDNYVDELGQAQANLLALQGAWRSMHTRLESRHDRVVGQLRLPRRALAECSVDLDKLQHAETALHDQLRDCEEIKQQIKERIKQVIDREAALRHEFNMLNANVSHAGGESIGPLPDSVCAAGMPTD